MHGNSQVRRADEPIKNKIQDLSPNLESYGCEIISMLTSGGLSLNKINQQQKTNKQENTIKYGLD